MKRLLAGLAALVLWAAGAGAGGDATKPGKTTIEPVYFSASRKLDDKKFGFSSESTSFQFVLAVPGKQFLGVEPTSKISELKDDKGTSLLSTGFIQSNFAMNRIATDRSAMVVGIYSNVAPAKGASKIHLKGNLVVRCGLEEKSTDEKEVELKDKAEAKMGDYTLKVTQEKGFGGFGGMFSITGTSPNIKSVSVKGDDGTAVEVITGFSTGFGTSWTTNYTLRKPVKKGKISVTYFSKDEKVTVPVDITIGLGL
jgi:hypothetical protein